MKRNFEEVMLPTTKYSWKFEDDKIRDLRVYEIRKSTTAKPYTVLIHQYSKIGDRQLFNDLFWCDSWDEKRGAEGVSDDVQFCICLWKELGLENILGPFLPKHIEHDLQRSPIVYREFLENVMARRYGKGLIDTTSAVCDFHPTEGVRKLEINLDTRMSLSDSERLILDTIRRAVEESHDMIE